MPSPIIQRNRIFTSSLDRNTKDYRDRVYAIGSSIDLSSLKAIDRYTKGCRSDGTWDLQFDVGTFAGNSINGALVKLKYPSGKQSFYSNLGYSGSNYSEPTGIQGATNKYLNSGLTINDLGSTPTLAFYLREAVSSGTTNNWFMGAGTSDGTFLGRGNNNSRDVFSHTPSLVYASVLQSSSIGFWAGSRFGNNDQRLYKNGSLIITDASTQSANTGTLGIFVGAWNSNGTAFGHLTKKYSFAAVCSLFTDAQMSLFYSRVQRLQEELGRGV